MTKEHKVSVTPADSYPLGHAKENKDASAYTGFQYPAGGGNDIGVYKQPMTNPNGTAHEAIVSPGNGIDKNNSKGNYSAENKHGEKIMRGYGAATKGIKTRGPMA